ncbi:tetratricopeptide repeat protein [Calycomorphotria hydatis]|uniref:Lipoprotein NlpI n=1 Tax=Calycomorphotria hydatis TaxID=2528027 RepID=A0A517T6W6_9PLAN|nr:hypothetical protein [Calycomorphotria hydatis]QDT64119.1 Lipoprotein NlpI precursor [Calycomorphotria hydatis]
MNLKLTVPGITLCVLATSLLNGAEPAPNAFEYYRRGVQEFQQGNFQQSVTNFDKYVELEPTAEKKLWERGISHYYAGKYAEGAAQFALYQTHDDNDVENSVWRFLCMARSVGIEKARVELLPIERDPRIPMMRIYDLFRGQATPDDVLKAARAGTTDERILAGRLFYAHLYLGLFAEANGDAKTAEKYIRLAAKANPKVLPISGYMHDVAKVHATLFNKQ